jgi:hypothetical protein
MDAETKKILGDFWKTNKFMLGLSAISLASLLAIAPFNSSAGQSRLTSQGAVFFFLQSIVLGKIVDVSVAQLSRRQQT